MDKLVAVHFLNGSNGRLMLVKLNESVVVSDHHLLDFTELGKNFS
jgi:hypothetical protein